MGFRFNIARTGDEHCLGSTFRFTGAPLPWSHTKLGNPGPRGIRDSGVVSPGRRTVSNRTSKWTASIVGLFGNDGPVWRCGSFCTIACVRLYPLTEACVKKDACVSAGAPRRTRACRSSCTIAGAELCTVKGHYTAAQIRSRLHQYTMVPASTKNSPSPPVAAATTASWTESVNTILRYHTMRMRRNTNQHVRTQDNPPECDPWWCITWEARRLVYGVAQIRDDAPGGVYSSMT